MWFEMTGDHRLTHHCASENCGGQPTWRLEAGGVGSDYCSGCKAMIEKLADDSAKQSARIFGTMKEPK